MLGHLSGGAKSERGSKNASSGKTGKGYDPESYLGRQCMRIRKLKKLFWSMVRGFAGSDDYSPEMLFSILIVGGADHNLHELLTEMIAEEVLEE